MGHKFESDRNNSSNSTFHRPQNLSLRQRLPLLIALLLAGVIVATTVFSYRGVRDSALAVGKERLANLTLQFSNLLQQSATGLTVKTASSANEASVKEFMASQSDQSRSAASTVLRQFAAPQDSSSLQVELWSANNSRLLTLPEGSPEVPVDIQSELQQATKEPFKAVGKIYQVGDKVVYPIIGAAKDSDGKVLGYLVRWRKLTGGPETRKQLTDLIGNQATLYFGNAEGSLWTDLVKPMPQPPVPVKTTLDLSRYSRDRVQVMAMGRPVMGTPWFVVIEFPEQPLFVQANQFLRRSIIIGAILFLLGVLVTFLLTRSITRPLNSLTEAATAISSGDYSRVVETTRNDELGKLATAFNTMSARVRESQHDLEKKIATRTRELEETNKELESFSYSVSHDLRAPLRAINGFSRILVEEHKSSLSEDAIAHLERITENARMMGQLVDDLLNFSRLSRQPLQKRFVDVSDLVQQVLSEMNSEQDGRRLDVRIGNLPKVDADARLLKQVYVNLLSNAFKYTRHRDQARIEIGARGHDSATVFYVKDNGAGFDMKYAGKLFGVFQRLHRAEEFEGTGVGLAIVQRIVHRHGGKVWAESELNKGATFSFELPANLH